MILYNSPSSQPCRSVIWLCLIKELPFVMGPQPDYQAIQDGRNDDLRFDTGTGFPRGQIPAIDDDGFGLGEMAAILLYLCEKHGWHDFYPTHVETRARINEYLHMHHTMTRLLMSKLMAPHVVGPLMSPYRNPNPLSILDQEVTGSGVHAQDPYIEGNAVARKVIGYFDRYHFGRGWKFLCGTPEPSIADLACYEELAQLRYANLFDFSGFPQTEAWLDRVAALPRHDAAHTYNIALGDIRTEPNSMPRFMVAVERAVAALLETGLVSLP